MIRPPALSRWVLWSFGVRDRVFTEQAGTVRVRFAEDVYVSLFRPSSIGAEMHRLRAFAFER